MTPSPGKTKVREYAVVADGREGVCFAWTYWGNGRVRWYWIRFHDNSEKAFDASQVHPV